MNPANESIVAAKCEGSTVTKPSLNGELVIDALKTINDPNGATITHLKTYIAVKHSIGIEEVITFLSKYLEEAVDDGTLIQVPGKGFLSAFKLAPPKDVSVNPVEEKENSEAGEQKADEDLSDEQTEVSTKRSSQQLYVEEQPEREMIRIETQGTPEAIAKEKVTARVPITMQPRSKTKVDTKRSSQQFGVEKESESKLMKTQGISEADAKGKVTERVRSTVQTRPKTKVGTKRSSQRLSVEEQPESKITRIETKGSPEAIAEEKATTRVPFTILTRSKTKVDTRRSSKQLNVGKKSVTKKSEFTTQTRSKTEVRSKKSSQQLDVKEKSKSKTIKIQTQRNPEAVAKENATETVLFTMQTRSKSKVSTTRSSKQRDEKKSETKTVRIETQGNSEDVAKKKATRLRFVPSTERMDVSSNIRQKVKPKDITVKVFEAISVLGKNGCSLRTIKRYLEENCGFTKDDISSINSVVKSGILSGVLVGTNGTSLTGSFKLVRDLV